MSNAFKALSHPTRREILNLLKSGPKSSGDLTDAFQVKEKLGAAIERARSGGGPTLIEVLTYRFRGHSMSDPGKYRTKEEMNAFRQRDPMELTGRALQELHGMTEEQLEELDEAIIAEMDAAEEFATASPLPEPEHRFRNIIIEEEG